MYPIFGSIERDFPIDPIFWDAISRKPWINVEHISSTEIDNTLISIISCI